MAKYIQRQNNWQREAYDRINLTVPKGSKTEIKRLADERGLSVNALLWQLLIDAGVDSNIVSKSVSNQPLTDAIS